MYITNCYYANQIMGFTDTIKKYVEEIGVLTNIFIADYYDYAIYFIYDTDHFSNNTNIKTGIINNKTYYSLKSWTCLLQL